MGGSGGTAGTGGSGGAGDKGGSGGLPSGVSGGTVPCDPASAPPTCKDANTLVVCNPDDKLTYTVNCADYEMAVGIVTKGCEKGTLNTNTGQVSDFCGVGSYSDQSCYNGAAAIQACEKITNSAAMITYEKCFTDNKARMAVTCFSKYVTPTMKTPDYCAMAEANCPSVTGQGGMGGASSGGSGP